MADENKEMQGDGFMAVADKNEEHEAKSRSSALEAKMARDERAERAEKARDDEEEEEDNIFAKAKPSRENALKSKKKLFTGKSTILKMGVDHPFRKVMINIVSHKAFDIGVALVIGFNVIIMALDYPGAKIIPAIPSSLFVSLEWFFRVFYTIESVLKLLAMGVVCHENSYLRDGFNALDFVVVVTSWLSVMLSEMNVSFLRVFRTLRAFRAATFMKDIRILIQALFRAFYYLKDVFVVTVFFLMIFGLFGMQLFQGKLRNRCHDSETLLVNNMTADMVCLDGAMMNMDPNGHVGVCLAGDICMDSGVNPNFGTSGYDEFIMAFITIWQCASLEGWVDVTYYMLEGTPNGIMHFIVIMFNIAIVFVVGYFMLSIITGLVVTAYQTTKEDNELQAQMKLLERGLAPGSEQDQPKGSAVVAMAPLLKLSKEEQKSDDELSSHTDDAAAAAAAAAGPHPEKEEGSTPVFKGPSELCYRLASNKWFDVVMMFIIFLNTVAMVTVHHVPPHERLDTNEAFLFSIWWNGFLMDLLNYIFTTIFVCEILIKLLAFGIKGFLKDSFNIFDAAVVLLSIIEISIQLVFPGFNVGISALRAARAVRVLKLAKNLQYIQFVIRVLAASAAGGVAMGILLTIFWFIFVLMGGFLFAGGLVDSEGDLPRMHFEYFGWSWVVVFMIMGGENWNDVLYNISGSTNHWGALYCVALWFLTNAFFLNLFLAILLGNFEESKDDDNEEPHTEEKLELLRGKTVTTFRPKINGRACCMDPSHWLRKKAFALASHDRFEILIMFVIGFSTFLLFFDDVHFEGYPIEFRTAVITLDYISTVIFLFEMVVKMVAFGFFHKDSGYFRDSWNRFDFFVIVMALVDTTFDLIGISSSLGFFKALRALRALRAIRMVRRDESLLAVVTALVHVIPCMVNTLFLMCIMLLVLSIMFIQFFGGKFAQCETLGGEVIWNTNMEACAALADTVWKNPEVGNFDNFAYAFLTGFEMSTLEMWPDVMLRAVDISDGNGRVRDATMLNAGWFMLFIFFMNWVVFQLLVGSVADTFSVAKAETTGAVLLSKEQNQWLALQNLLLNVKPGKQYRLGKTIGRFRKKIFFFVTHDKFDLTISVCIMLNVLVMLLSCETCIGVPPLYQEVLNIFNNAFAFLFLLEAIVKLVALDVQYFSVTWNVFDLFIVVCSLIGFTIETLQLTVAFDITILRVFRVLRLVRLIKRIPVIRKLLANMSLAIPGFSNVLKMMALFHVIFAVVGMQLFKDLDLAPTDGFHTNHANFKTFGNAMLTLFRITTGESYNGIMHDIMYMEGCPYTTWGCIWFALVFFMGFVILSQIMIANMLVASVLEEFESVGGEASSGRCPLEGDDISEFLEAWHTYLPPRPWYKSYFYALHKEDQILSWTNFENILADLTKGLALDPTKGQMGSIVDITALHIPVYEEEVCDAIPEPGVFRSSSCMQFKQRTTDCVHYIDVLLALCKFAFWQARLRHLEEIGGDAENVRPDDYEPENIAGGMKALTQAQDRVERRFASGQRMSWVAADNFQKIGTFTRASGSDTNRDARPAAKDDDQAPLISIPEIASTPNKPSLTPIKHRLVPLVAAEPEADLELPKAADPEAPLNVPTHVDTKESLKEGAESDR